LSRNQEFEQVVECVYLGHVSAFARAECHRSVRSASANTAIAVLAAFLLAAPPSLAESIKPTRAEYVEEVEPICRSETLAHRTILQGVEEMINHGKLKQAAPHLMRASTVMRGAIKRVGAVPRPPADMVRLTRWLQFAKSGGKLLRKMGLALQSGNHSKAQKIAKELLTETKRANATVAGFNFNYCRVNPAHFV
jgi:hypothetical protein